MAEFSKLIITKKGQSLIAKILAGQGAVEFTNIASSSTKYNMEQLEELTALEQIKQTSLISGITRTSETAIKAEASFTNIELTEGYYMQTLGLYCMDPQEGEVLYAVTIENSGNCYMPPYNGVTVSGAYIQLVTSVGNADNVSLEIDPAAIATIGNIEEIKNTMKEQAALNEVRFTEIKSHGENKSNPHQVTKEQIGLGAVENTADLNKPISTATQKAITETSVTNKQYVDNKVAALVNGAPEALDTLLELANAFNSNKDLVDTLSEAIGKKANQTEVDNHQKNTTFHITAAERTKWNTVDAALSATSTYPVQNKVVKTAFDQQNTKNSSFESGISQLNSNLEQCFQSVSSGKALVAAAITDKGVSTAANSTFQVMATNIKNISSLKIGFISGGSTTLLNFTPKFVCVKETNSNSPQYPRIAVYNSYQGYNQLWQNNSTTTSSGHISINGTSFYVSDWISYGAYIAVG